MIARNVMRLKMIFLFQDVDVFICSHDVGVGHRVIEVFFVVTDILLGGFKDVLDLCF